VELADKARDDKVGNCMGN